MAITATAKDTGISVKKLLPILSLVRGRRIEEALSILEFMTSPAATNVAKVVKSASSNAENEMLTQGSDLRILEIYANEVPSLKRFRARAKGRVGKITRRNSHITVVVGEVGGN